MARNSDIVLTPSQRGVLASATKRLRPFVGTDTVVTVHYVKRDGSEAATLTGTVESVKNNGDHGTVTLVTEKGYRSANLHTITGISL